MLGRYQRVLVIGAHPDDEDTQLLAVLARGFGAEAAYLSLTRGEGGQNLIGPELGEALGLIRTEELQGARRLDGARQLFTRAYDFGYSKTLHDVWRQWPRDSVLKDVVRAVRRFRPQVVVSIFSGTPRDGHGQHQAAGWAAHEAFRVAGDEARFPELAREEGLVPWSPWKLYRSSRFDTLATTLRIPAGVLDPIEGQSLHQIAMRSRSLHRSQDMGTLQRIGPSTVRLCLAEDRTGAGAGGLFAGIDTTLGAIPRPAATALPADGWDALTEALRALRPSPTPARLARAHALLAEAAARVPGPELRDQLDHLEAAIFAADQILCDALSDDDRVIAGQVVRITLACWNAGATPRTVTGVLFLAGSPVARVSLALPPDALASEELRLPLPDALALSRPYFLAGERSGALYAWPTGEPELLGLPREPALLMAEFRTDRGGVARREVARRESDQAVGEVRHPVLAVPRIDVRLDRAVQVWPAASTDPIVFTVALTHGAADSTAGLLRLELPSDWPEVAPQPFGLTREGERRTFRFTVRPPRALRPGALTIRAVAEDEAGRRFGAGIRSVSYPHIRPLTLVEPAEVAVRVSDLALPRLARIGYVRGASDLVPEALAGVGLSLTLLDADLLERGDLDRFDAIVIGSRAYETDPVLVAANERLLAYARRGGLVLVQYQQYQYFNGGYAPYLLTVGGQGPRRAPSTGDGARLGGRAGGSNRHDRVADEDAPVTVLRPDHPVVTRPNRLGAADWEGWVQERGLYFARQWDTTFVPVLAMHDPGEEPQEGGLLVARMGRGHYVYTGLSFFRQLPAGVPGAFRLFANLLALAAPEAP